MNAVLGNRILAICIFLRMFPKEVFSSESHWLTNTTKMCVTSNVTLTRRSKLECAVRCPTPHCFSPSYASHAISIHVQYTACHLHLIHLLTALPDSLESPFSTAQPPTRTMHTHSTRPPSLSHTHIHMRQSCTYTCLSHISHTHSHTHTPHIHTTCTHTHGSQTHT